MLRPDHVIRVSNASPSDEAEVQADGSEVGRLCCGETIEIMAGETRARLLVSQGGSFYHNVEELFNRARHAF